MMKQTKYLRLMAGFAVIVAMMLGLSIVSFQKMQSLADLTAKLYNHPLAVSNAVLKVDSGIISMHRHMKDVALARNSAELEFAISQVEATEKQIYQHFEILLDRFLGDKSRIVEARQIFSDWGVIRAEVIELTRATKYGEAAAITKGKGAIHVDLMNTQTDGLIEFANNKASEFLKNSASQYQMFKISMIWLLIGAFIVSAIVVFFVISSVKRADTKQIIAEKALQSAHDQLEKQVEQRTRQYKEAKDEAMQANAIKSEFLASMSHDLRTPLNAIIGFSDIMRNETFGPLGNMHYEQYAEDIFNSGALLVSLINDILDLSKIEAGKYELSEEILDVPALIRTSFMQLENMADAHRQTLSIDIPADPPALLGDKRVMIQILNNLLSNAIKFTPDAGEINATMRLEEDDCISLAIGDTGIGMSQESIVKALRPFEQAEALLSRQHEGTGLGVHLCVNFMKLFAGTLDIDSDIGKGTTITLKFPSERTVKL